MALQLPTRDTRVHWYLGTDAALAKGGQGTDDLGTGYTFRAKTRSYAPAGIGGECIFTNLYISLLRSNTEDMTIEIVPIVDGVAQDAVALVLEAVAAPLREVHEVGLAVFYPSAANPQIATAMRGCWFQTEVRSSGAIPAGRTVVEGIELEHEVVTEGRQASNASE